MNPKQYTIRIANKEQASQHQDACYEEGTWRFDMTFEVCIRILALEIEILNQWLFVGYYSIGERERELKLDEWKTIAISVGFLFKKTTMLSN
ncbi:hypothetical protein L204_104588 [Cryptococcus depauperatus]